MRILVKAITTRSVLFLLLCMILILPLASTQVPFVFSSGMGGDAAVAPVNWPMFRANLQRTGTTSEIVAPPLTLKWNYTTLDGAAFDSSPAVVGGVVYIVSTLGIVYALDASTGAFKWSYETEALASYVQSSPAVSGGLVYLASAHTMYALDASTGAKKWNYTMQTKNIQTPSSPAVSGGVVYVGSGAASVFAFNASTGAVKWKFTKEYLDNIVSSPAVVGGVVYIGSWDGKLYALDASTGEEKWSSPTHGGIFSTPAVSGGLVYVGSDDTYVYAFDASTGVQRWNCSTGERIRSSPAVSGGVVYIGSWDGKLYALNAFTGELKWSYEVVTTVLHPYVESSPAVSGGFVYFGSGDHRVYALDASTGVQKWNYTSVTWDGGEGFFSSPAVSGGFVYIGSREHKVYAFQTVPAGSRLTVTSMSPPNGASVSSPVELKVRVTYHAAAVSGATVHFYVDSSEVASSASLPTGYASYVYSAPSPGSYSWHAMAEKVGYALGTSATRTFTVSAIYAGAITGVTVTPDAAHIGQGSRVTFTVSVANTGPSDIASAIVRLKIYKPTGVVAATLSKPISAFTHGSSRNVDVVYMLAATAPTGTWTYDVFLYRLTTLLDDYTGQTFTVEAPVKTGTIVSVVDAPDPVLHGHTATFTVTFKNTGNIVWSSARVTVKILKPNGQLATQRMLTVMNVVPGVDYARDLTWLVPATSPTGQYTYTVTLTYLTTTVATSPGHTLTVN